MNLLVRMCIFLSERNHDHQQGGWRLPLWQDCFRGLFFSGIPFVFMVRSMVKSGGRIALQTDKRWQLGWHSIVQVIYIYTFLLNVHSKIPVCIGNIYIYIYCFFPWNPYPRCSMYGIFIYIHPQKWPKGSYIFQHHGASGYLCVG